MADNPIIDVHHLTRRDVLRLLGLGGMAFCTGTLSGCAVDPVTGKNTMVFLSEQDEVDLDRANSPHQLSSDYGRVQDSHLQTYLNQVGRNIASRSHRPQMPYSFQAVNASYINAYAFPGGTIACTRGILVELDNEAELAALMGHEIGHVNARHAAEQTTKSILAAAVIMGATIYASTTDYRDYAGLIQTLGGVGVGALLAHYSRDNEREADALGMEYMTRSGYDPYGMSGLLGILQKNGQRNPSAIEMMFATHPMSSERFRTAQQKNNGSYAEFHNDRYYRERYRDNISRLYSIKNVIKNLQNGDKEMRRKRYFDAENHFQQALYRLPNDYAALVMMAKCQVALGRSNNATEYTRRARQIYPDEPQALHVEGVSRLMSRQYRRAGWLFERYEQLLPGNTDTIFFKALVYEGINDRRNAATEYMRYLNSVQKGYQANHARARLTGWGYINPLQQQQWQYNQYQNPYSPGLRPW